MFSISRAMGAAQAGRYFSGEEYYLEEDGPAGNSRWYGKGAEALGLAGQVRGEDFRPACKGKHPGTGAVLVSPNLSRDKEKGAMVSRHRAGNDATLSAPKTVSIAYVLGVEGIREAHDAAVLAVLGHLEEHYSLYRSPDGIRNGTLLVASFTHETSRKLEPQLHSHNFLFNMTQAPDGSWKANWNRTIFQDQKSLGFLYRQELAYQLQMRGFEIVITDRSQMFFELKGIDPQLVKVFSSRRQAVERQVELWKKEGRFIGVRHGKRYEMAVLETRDPKRKATPAELERSFEKVFESRGTSAQEVKRELEHCRGMERGRAIVAEYSAPEVVRLAAERLVDKEAILDRARLLDQAVLVSGGGHSLRELNLAIDRSPEGVLRLGPDGKGREYYTTPEMRRIEAENLATVEGLRGFRSLVSREELGHFLNRVEEGDGIRLSPGQREQVENELCGSSAICAVEGKAGAGKTLACGIVERFNAEVLRPQGREHCTINLAFTGQAAHELGAATGRPPYTVDAFLNAQARGEVALQWQVHSSPMVEVEREKILIPDGAQVVLRVDEAGLLGAKQGGHLLRIVQELQEQGVQTKLELIGDTRQMQAIQAGDLFRQVLELEKEGVADVAHLDEIRRQRDPQLLEIARELNREDRLPGESAVKALDSLNMNGELHQRESRDELVSAAVEKYRTESSVPSHDLEKAAAGERQSVLLITTTNADRIELNRAIREARIAAGEIEDGKSCRVLAPVPQGITADCYRHGDELVFSGYRGEDGKMQRWGARLNTVGTVTGIDHEKNKVEVRYSFTTRNRNGEEMPRTVTRSFSAAEMAGKTTVYREEERKLAAGDRIIALKNDRELRLQNGSLGTVRSVEGTDRITASFDGREVTLDLARYRHLDYAYAVTIHKSQGATVEHSIWFAPVRNREVNRREFDGELPVHDEPTGRVSYNALNVAVTRARYGATIFTNSIEELTREVAQVDRKTSTLDPPCRERGHEPPAVHPAIVLKRPPDEERLYREAEREGHGMPGKEINPCASVNKQLPGFGSAHFDRGASLAKRLDELAAVGKPIHLPDDLLKNLPRTIQPIPPGVEIVKQLAPIPLKEIDLDIGK